MLLWSAYRFRKKAKEPRWPLKWIAPSVAAFFAVVAYILFQSDSFVGLFAAHPFWQDAAQNLDSTLNPTITVDTNATETALSRLLTYGGVFWLSAHIASDRRGAATLLSAVALTSLAYAIYGLIVYISGSETILGEKKWAYIGSLTSTFVNHSAFATYAGLGLVAGIGLAIDALAINGDGKISLARYRLRLETTLTPVVVTCIFAAPIIAMAILLTHSRMGFVSGALGVCVLLICSMATGMLRWRLGMAITAFLAICLGGIFLLAGEGTMARMETMTDADERLAIYATTMRAIHDHWLLGTGYGTFFAVFPSYRDASLPYPVFYEMAHNTYLETALELGVPAACALGFSVIWIIAVCVRGTIIRQKDKIFPCVAVAASAITGAISVTDFSAQTPAVAITFASLLGIGFAQSFSSRKA